MNKLKIILTSLIISTFSYILPANFVMVIPVSSDGCPHEFGPDLVPSSPLRQAVISGDLARLKELIASSSTGNDDAQSYRGVNYGETLLHCAAANGKLGVMIYLNRVIGINPNVRDKSGATPAHYAAGSRMRANQIESIALLKRLGADMGARDHAGSSILDDAKEEGMPESLIDALIAIGVPSK